MTDGLSRHAGLLAALLVLLARGLSLTPSDLTVAGGVGLTVYGLLALSRPVFSRLVGAPQNTTPHDD